ncbi:MAG: NmrA family NAD(P)-binding protein [Rhizobiaceae bacterium]|nr:NmrA family NAD(P)-binding protein [Rhizobiaceae bacterium]
MAQKILVSGASGHLGRLVLDALMARGVDAGDIIATTRDPSRLASYAARGVDVRAADFNDADLTRKAFAGADRMVLISTDALDDKGTRQRQQLAAIDAARAAGVKHIVYTSLPDPEISKVIFAPDHLATEKAIRASGLSHTLFRNTWYQENMFMSLPQVLKSGQWYTSAGNGRIAHVARADCADAIAAALASGTTENATYTLTGDTLRTTDEIAALAGEITGKAIQVVHLTDGQLADGMKAAGVPDFLIPTLVSFDAATRAGHLGALTGDFEKLTGRKPRPFRAFFEENRAALIA